MNLPLTPKIPFAKRTQARAVLKKRLPKKIALAFVLLGLVGCGLDPQPLTAREVDRAGEWCAPHGALRMVYTNPNNSGRTVVAQCDNGVAIEFARIPQ